VTEDVNYQGPAPFHVVNISTTEALMFLADTVESDFTTLQKCEHRHRSIYADVFVLLTGAICLIDQHEDQAFSALYRIARKSLSEAGKNPAPYLDRWCGLVVLKLMLAAVLHGHQPLVDTLASIADRITDPNVYNGWCHGTFHGKAPHVVLQSLFTLFDHGWFSRGGDDKGVVGLVVTLLTAKAYRSVARLIAVSGLPLSMCFDYLRAEPRCHYAWYMKYLRHHCRWCIGLSDLLFVRTLPLEDIRFRGVHVFEYRDVLEIVYAYLHANGREEVAALRSKDK
jgi:hypothetical protein